MTMQETEDLLGRGKIKTVVKEDNSQLRYTKTEELVIVGSEPLMSDTYTSDESYGDYSEPETSEAKKLMKTILPKNWKKNTTM